MNPTTREELVEMAVAHTVRAAEASAAIFGMSRYLTVGGITEFQRHQERVLELTFVPSEWMQPAKPSVHPMCAKRA